MEVDELTDEEIEELDNFLQYEFNYDIYQELTYEDDVNFELFEPLEFFRLLYKQITFIKENKTKPLFISRTLKKLDLSDLQFYYLYRILLIFFNDDKEKDEKINVCYREIYKLQYYLDVYGDDEESEDETDKIESSVKLDRFQLLLEHLESLPTTREKIAHLVMEKTKYEQNKSGLDFNFNNEKTFAEKCQLEINKLKEIMKLEMPTKGKTNNIEKDNDLNIEVATLFLNYLLDFAKEKSRENLAFKNKTKLSDATKNKITAFLTPYAEKQIKKLPPIFKKTLAEIAENGENSGIKDKFFQDMQVVRKYFEMVGLSEITSKIDADLGEKQPDL